MCRQASEVVTHSYEADDTSFINIVFLSPLIFIFINPSTHLFIVENASFGGCPGARRHYDLLFSLATVWDPLRTS